MKKKKNLVGAKVKYESLRFIEGGQPVQGTYFEAEAQFTGLMSRVMRRVLLWLATLVVLLLVFAFSTPPGVIGNVIEIAKSLRR